MGVEYTKEDVEGAGEVDIVYSGLEEIMTHATSENWELAC